jgi:hypothetical protein
LSEQNAEYRAIIRDVIERAFDDYDEDVDGPDLSAFAAGYVIEELARRAKSKIVSTISGGWNYRMFHRQVPDGGGGTSDEFTIREAYYDPRGHVTAWSAEPSHPYGETKWELMDDASRMSSAISLPVIEISEDGNELIQNARSGGDDAAR